MNNLNPKVSIIITTYNRAEILIKRSLSSVLGQTYPDFECIVVDDCSFDNTREVIEKLNSEGAEIKYVRANKNGGLSAARNLGLKNAKGKYIVFIDDDDEIFPNFLEVLIPKIEKLSEKFGAITCARIGSHRFVEEYLLPNPGKSFYTSVSTGWIIKREVYNDISYYDERLRSHEDLDFGIRFFKTYKAYILDKPLKRVYNFYDKPHLSTPTIKSNISLNIFLEKNLPIFIEKGDKRELSYIYRFAGWNYFLVGEKEKGKFYFRKAFNTIPNLRNFLYLLSYFLGKNFCKLLLFLEAKIGALIRSKYNPKYRQYFKDIPPRKA